MTVLAIDGFDGMGGWAKGSGPAPAGTAFGQYVPTWGVTWACNLPRSTGWALATTHMIYYGIIVCILIEYY